MEINLMIMLPITLGFMIGQLVYITIILKEIKNDIRSKQ